MCVQTLPPNAHIDFQRGQWILKFVNCRWRFRRHTFFCESCSHPVLNHYPPCFWSSISTAHSCQTTHQHCIKSPTRCTFFMCVYSKICKYTCFERIHRSSSAVYVSLYMQLFVHIMLTVTGCSASPVGTDFQLSSNGVSVRNI